jgi:hypothetical protein
MKNQIKTLGIALLMVAGLGACKKDYPFPTPKPTTQVVTQGVWKVASMQENGTEFRDKFAQYEFRFEKTGLAIAWDSSVKNEGKWWSGYDRDHYAFVLTFNTNNDLLQKVSSNWTIVKQSPSVIELKDFTDDSDGTEYLMFRKL